MAAPPDLHLRLRPSRLQRRWLRWLPLACLPLPWFSALPMPIRLLLFLLLLAWVIWHERQAPAREANRASALHFYAEHIEVDRPGGTEYHTLAAGSHVHPGLIVLALRAENGKTSRLVLWPDSATADELRRLRVRLYWAGHGPADAI